MLDVPKKLDIGQYSVESGRSNEFELYGAIAHIDEPIDSAIAGAVGGYFVWARYTSVHYQIVLYLLSRILVASAKLAVTRVLLHRIFKSIC